MVLQIPVFFALYNVLLNSIRAARGGLHGRMSSRYLSAPDDAHEGGRVPDPPHAARHDRKHILMQSQTPVAPQRRR